MLRSAIASTNEGWQQTRLMAQYKTVVTPLRQQWSYHILHESIQMKNARNHTYKYWEAKRILENLYLRNLHVLRQNSIFFLRHISIKTDLINGLEHNCSISSVLAMEWPQSCAKPSLSPTNTKFIADIATIRYKNRIWMISWCSFSWRMYAAPVFNVPLSLMNNADKLVDF